MGRNKGGKNRKYSFEEKLSVCQKYYNEHLSLKDLATKEQVPSGTIARWIIEYKDQGEVGLKAKKRGNPTQVYKSNKGMSELERVKLENLKLRIEVERLKKGYTVKGVGSKKVYITLDGKIIKS